MSLWQRIGSVVGLADKPGHEVNLEQPPAVTNSPVYANPALTSSEISYKPFESLGAVGTVFFSGLIAQEEYNHDLQGDELLRTTDKMWRSDPQIAAELMVLMLPLLEAKYTVEAASTEQQDVDIAQFVQDNLFGGMQRTWSETLQFILLEWLRDGFAVLEKVYTTVDKTDGKVRLRKLAPRISKSIYRWYPGPDDELDRIQQRVYIPDDKGISGIYIYPVIPASKLVLFSHMMEGNNYAGISVLRPAYKPWYMKDQLERLACVAAERLAAGVPVFSEPQGPVQKSDRDAAASVLSALHTHEKTYVLEPYGWQFRFEGGTGMDLLPLIEYFSLQIVRSVLAQFLNLDRGGSYALSMDISSFFMQALHSKAQYICDVFNAQVIRPLVDLNYEVDRYPTLHVSDLDKRDIDKFMTGLGAILATGFLTHNADTENAIRQLLDLPDLPPDATPAGGGSPTVDTDSGGKGPATEESTRADAGTVEQKQAAQLAAQQPYPAWLQEEVAAQLAQCPEGMQPALWRQVVFEQAAAVAAQEAQRSVSLASNKGNPEALRKWFNDGAGGAIDWGQHGDFAQCVAVAGKYMDDPEGYCNERHQDAVGGPPGSEDT